MNEGDTLRGQVIEALLGAFDSYGMVTELALEGLNVNLQTITLGDNLGVVVSDLVDWTIRQHKLQELINYALELLSNLQRNPGDQLRAVARTDLSKVSPSLATYMVPPLPAPFVPRSGPLADLRAHLLGAEQNAPQATTVALYGSGGGGKSTLAAAICYDPAIRSAFSDGILWVTLGQQTNRLVALAKFYEGLTGSRLAFADDEDGATHLADAIADKTCLIVIDDLWNIADLQPFLRGRPHCARLITTRQFDIANKAAVQVPIDEMTPDEAAQLLIARVNPPPPDLTPFRTLGERLGEWPLLLTLANGTLRVRLAREDTLDAALAYLNEALDAGGVTAFDQRNANDRNQAVTQSLNVSLNLLEPAEQIYCTELGILPEDADVPLAVVKLLWNLTVFETEKLSQMLADLSLIKLDLRSGTIRQHDLIRDYLAQQMKDPNILHARLVEAWGQPKGLPTAYAATYLIDHLIGANRLTDPQAQAQVRGALRLAAHTLAVDSSQLPAQLLGRLSPPATDKGIWSVLQQAARLLMGRNNNSPEISALLAHARRWASRPWMRPLASCLTPPGGPLIRTLIGHTGEVTAVAITSDGQCAVSGAIDHTLRLWDLNSGQTLRIFTGHTAAVRAVAVTPDGQHAVSASDDRTLRIWDLHSGQELSTLTGHTAAVRAVAVTPDGYHAVSASADRTLRLWNLATEASVARFDGDGEFNCCAIAPDGRTIVAGDSLGRVHFLRLEGV